MVNQVTANAVSEEPVPANGDDADDPDDVVTEDDNISEEGDGDGGSDDDSDNDDDGDSDDDNIDDEGSHGENDDNDPLEDDSSNEAYDEMHPVNTGLDASDLSEIGFLSEDEQAHAEAQAVVRTEAQAPKLSSKEPDPGLGESVLASGILKAFNNETTPISELKAWTGLSFISTSAIRNAMSWGSSVAGDEVLPEISSPDADVFRSAKETTSTPTDFQYPKKDQFGGQIPIRKSSRTSKPVEKFGT